MPVNVLMLISNRVVYYCSSWNVESCYIKNKPNNKKKGYYNSQIILKIVCSNAHLTRLHTSVSHNFQI